MGGSFVYSPSPNTSSMVIAHYNLTKFRRLYQSFKNLILLCNIKPQIRGVRMGLHQRRQGIRGTRMGAPFALTKSRTILYNPSKKCYNLIMGLHQRRQSKRDGNRRPFCNCLFNL